MERANEEETAQRGAALLAASLRGAVAPVRVEAGETVVRQGDPGRRFYFVESGALDVVVTSDMGLRLPVARLGPGSHFGEMSILAGMPVSADVVACEASVLYAPTAEEFDQLVRRNPDLLEHLAGELAFRLKRTNEQLAAQQQRQATLSKLVSFRPSSPFKRDIPSFGAKMTAALAEASGSDLPLLITGEKGVGKRALALQVHSTSARRDEAVLVVDCRELSPEEARSQLFGDASPDFVSRFADSLGYLQAADRGTLILANVDSLSAEVQADVATFLRTQQESSADDRVDVRLIATADRPGAGSGAEEGQRGPLFEALTRVQVIDLRPLRERRRDIVPLAEHFLERAGQLNGSPPKQLGESAVRELQTYDFRFENVEELRQVINLAAALAEGDVVHSEHLFFGSGTGADALQIDLLRWPRVEQLFLDKRFMVGLKALVAAAFAGIIAACFVAPASALGRFANLMVWGVWWPVLVIASVLLGRVWCAVCPLSSGSEVVQRAAGRGLSAPDRLKRIGPALALAGFVGIIWVEHVTGMIGNPRYTALLLLGLAAIAAAVGWLYQRHAWCRYLCPLGAMGGVLSVASALRLQARKEVCQASCTGHECYKGTEHAQGCPMFNHAMFLTSGQHCKLCFECLRACPTRSPRLVLQLPVRDIWRSNSVGADLAPLAVVVGLMALVLAALPSGSLHSPLNKWWFTAGALAVVAAGVILLRLLRPRDRTESGTTLSWVARLVYAFAPAAAAALFAFHVQSTPWLDEISLRVGMTEVEVFGLSLLRLVQGSAVTVGGLMSLWALWRLCRQRAAGKLAMALVAWTPLALLTAAYLVTALALLGRG